MRRQLGNNNYLFVAALLSARQASRNSAQDRLKGRGPSRKRLETRSRALPEGKRPSEKMGRDRP